jgi:Tol biopolymer transport system component
VRGNRSRLTFDPADESNPVWSPDGSQIAFSSSRRGGRDIYWTQVNQSGEETPVSESSQVKYLEEWSADGRWLFFHNLDDIYRIPARADDPKPERVVAGLGMQDRAHLSPNREWLAYTSDESGRLEVYVQALRPQGGRLQISTESGTEPFWRADGKELFFIKDSALMAVDVKEGSSGLIAGVPKRLFEAPFTPVTFRRNRYVVTPDGKRFLVITSAEAHQPERITVIVNWTGLLKR